MKPTFLGKKFRGELFDFIIRIDKQKSVLQLFFSISKKHFNAVKRNTIKRRIKEFYRTQYPSLTGELHYFIRKPFSLSNKEILRNAMNKSLEKIIEIK
ncbi:MAG: ribonuclease P protein component [Fibrobacteres bacterium]|nr:ribonuclease P protein component [Fibrobacterota bacterium]